MGSVQWACSRGPRRPLRCAQAHPATSAGVVTVVRGEVCVSRRGADARVALKVTEPGGKTGGGRVFGPGSTESGVGLGAWQMGPRFNGGCPGM